MYNIIPSTSDKIINRYIKDYITNSKLTNDTLYYLLGNKFSKKDINKIRKGTFIFGIDDFIYLTKKLNLDLEFIFKQIKI